MMEPLDFMLARKTVKNYACSNCWGELEMTPQDDKYIVTCKRCEDETKGYVTQHYVNRRRAESEFEELSATRLLQQLDIIPNPHKGKTTQQLLEELGF